jgi:hypothetical protein
MGYQPLRPILPRTQGQHLPVKEEHPMQAEWDRIEEPTPSGQSQNTETCAHPRLFGLPDGNSYTLVCESCTKRLVISYGAFIGGVDAKEFCLTALVKETFGDAWGLKAELQCRCSACKAKRYGGGLRYE